MKWKPFWKRIGCLVLMLLLHASTRAILPARAGVYTQELDAIQAMLKNGNPDSYGAGRDDLIAVWEGVRDMPSAQSLEEVKYIFQDFNGDGRPELVTGQENRITNLLTEKDGLVRNVFSGFVRDAWYYLGGNSFLNVGSGGMGRSVLGVYHLEADGTLACEQHYFTRWMSQNRTLEIYRNNTGSMDEAQSERLDMTAEAFNKLQETWMQQVKSLPWSSLGRYGEKAVEIAFYPPEENGTCPIEFIPARSLEDFHVMTLQATDVSEDGRVTYEAESDKAWGNLEKEERVRAEMVMESSARATAFSYRDESGYHRWTLRLSGEDGSLVMREE